MCGCATRDVLSFAWSLRINAFLNRDVTRRRETGDVEIPKEEKFESRSQHHNPNNIITRTRDPLKISFLSRQERPLDLWKYMVGSAYNPKHPWWTEFRPLRNQPQSRHGRDGKSLELRSRRSRHLGYNTTTRTESVSHYKTVPDWDGYT